MEVVLAVLVVGPMIHTNELCKECRRLLPSQERYGTSFEEDRQ